MYRKPWAKSQYWGYHVQPDRVRVVHNGIRLGSDSAVCPVILGVRIRDALGISHESNVIAMVARMYPDKGHRPMLEMMWANSATSLRCRPLLRRWRWT